MLSSWINYEEQIKERRRFKHKEGQRKGHKETGERTPLDGGAAVTQREKQVANLRAKSLRAKKDKSLMA